MKIRPDHYAHLRTVIHVFDTPATRQLYIESKLSDERYRWDLTYRAGMSDWVCNHLYPYLDDAHIDTALRAIVPPLTGAANV